MVRLTTAGRIVDSCVAQIPDHHDGVSVDCFVVMPNHVYAVLCLRATASLGVIVGTFKAASSRAARKSLWQRRFHDHVVRDETDLDRVREYVATNPLRWALDRENPSTDARNPVP
jgi:REP element-mobilizing transposase RayT